MLPGTMKVSGCSADKVLLQNKAEGNYQLRGAMRTSRYSADKARLPKNGRCTSALREELEAIRTARRCEVERAHRQVWARFGAFGGGVSPDSFVICAENGDGYCDSPKYLAAARRSYESTHYFVLLVSLLACVVLL